MKNPQVKGLLSQLRAAADAIKAQIHEADTQIAALTEQRQALTDAPVAKADLINFMRADIQRRAGNYQAKIKKWVSDSGFPFSFARLERTHKAGKHQPFPYLDGNPAHESFQQIDPDGVYWNFGELILERFTAALDELGLEVDSMPVVDRLIKIAEIDAELQKLNAQRDGLANDLISSGMYE